MLFPMTAEAGRAGTVPLREQRMADAERAGADVLDRGPAPARAVCVVDMSGVRVRHVG